MANHFCYDIETTDNESTAIILSVAIVWFDPTDPDVTFDELVDRTLYIKLDAKAQAAKGRTVGKDTLEWWKKQPEKVRELCFKPSTNDRSPEDAIQMLTNYVNDYGTKDSFIWARGTLDQLATESMIRSFDLKQFIHYNSWMDIRTFIRANKDTADHYGYCKVPGIDRFMLDKHNPITDICYDTLMIVKGE